MISDVLFDAAADIREYQHRDGPGQHTGCELPLAKVLTVIYAMAEFYAEVNLGNNFNRKLFDAIADLDVSAIQNARITEFKILRTLQDLGWQEHMARQARDSEAEERIERKIFDLLGQLEAEGLGARRCGIDSWEIYPLSD
jgi:hypothetical protein